MNKHASLCLHRSGYTVLATASPRNRDYVKSLGADMVFDQTQDDIGARVNTYSQDTLCLVCLTPSAYRTRRVSVHRHCLLTPAAVAAPPLSTTRAPEQMLFSVGTMLSTIWGEYFKSGDKEWPASTEDLEWTKEWIEMVDGLLGEGKIMPHRYVLRGNGLQGVVQGLEELKNGGGRDGKLVYLL